MIIHIRHGKVKDEHSQAVVSAESAGSAPLPPLVVAESGEARAGGAYRMVRGRPGSDLHLCLADNVSLTAKRGLEHRRFPSGAVFFC